MKVVFGHPTGNANVKAAAKGLMEANLLARFYTSIATFPGDVLDNLASVKALSELRRRAFDPALKSVTRTFPGKELGRLISGKLGFKNLVKHELGFFSIDEVYKGFDKKVAAQLKMLSKQGTRVLYAYEDAAAYSFTEAKRLEMKCLYDLPIGYWRSARQLLAVEEERWPKWASTLTGLADSDKKLVRKDYELSQADTIFVASQFTAKTLEQFPGELCPIKVIPYGFPAVTDKRSYRNLSSGKALKLLFVGGLSQRKGIADLFAAVEALGAHVELTVVGQKINEDCLVLNEALLKHTWIPSLPHKNILDIMRQHDVLIFPSLFEGFGLVITEAMSQGTPVITTNRTAGPDLIENNGNGWLIDAGNTFQLQQAIEKLLYNPGVIAENGKAAMETARKRPWEVYGRELVEAVKNS